MTKTESTKSFTDKLRKALKYLDDYTSQQLARAEAIPYPKKPKLRLDAIDQEHELNLYWHKEKRLKILEQKRLARKLNKELIKDVRSALQDHPKYPDYIEIKYGFIESDSLPKDKKGNLDHVAIARDFLKSSFAE